LKKWEKIWPLTAAYVLSFFLVYFLVTAYPVPGGRRFAEVYSDPWSLSRSFDVLPFAVPVIATAACASLGWMRTQRRDVRFFAVVPIVISVITLVFYISHFF